MRAEEQIAAGECGVHRSPLSVGDSALSVTPIATMCRSQHRDHTSTEPVPLRGNAGSRCRARQDIVPDVAAVALVQALRLSR